MGERRGAAVRILVTGGAGFIGANLCRRLVDEAKVQEVRVLDDLSTGSRQNLASIGAELFQGSILDRGALTECAAGMDAIVHLAARPSVPRSIEDPVSSHRVNADGTVQVLEVARAVGGPHVVVASSSSVYGANPLIPKCEDMQPLPVSPYAASKLATESYALAWQRSFGLPVLAFRFFNVYGPLQAAGHAYAAVIPAFISAAMAGDPLPVHGDGFQTRDFTFVDTVTEVIATALAERVTHVEPVNLAYGTRTDLQSVIGELEAVMGQELPRDHLPARAGDVRDSSADSSRLSRLFPEVIPVDLCEGLERTVDWFRTR